MNKTIKKTLTIGATTLMISNYMTTPTSSTALKGVDIVIHPGEYQGKPGKRLVGIDENFNIDCPLRYDEQTGWHLEEFDLNYKVSVALVKYLESQGVNVILQSAEGKHQDLNSAGKRAKVYNPTIYFSLHHNSYDENSSGYLFMTNEGDEVSQRYAKQMSNAMTSNPMLLSARENQINSGRIGELNQKPGVVNILFEAGFALSNKEEAIKCANDKQIEFIAKTLGNQLIQILNDMKNEKRLNDVYLNM